ncbi:septation protein SepH [uncultured Williamsia sp.]|uniref:septation protein SepH n=1 Tax=uncultured Williamsia sp. TaxID=259311 RepID=UPI0026046EC3|nr:septation protein SepH [uncultured Williamsia sp.]
MRELRVIGVDAESGSVICRDPVSGEEFTVPADDRLRAALRGDISRIGQIEIEMESALRPREIQARIRSGASVAQVAAAAGVSVDKIDRFAHPVLLERSRATEMAASSHPIRIDGPALSTLGEVVAAALGARGHDPDNTAWDAWKGDDNRWIVQVAWRVGRSENRAHWRFLPGSSGGTTEPLDEMADELTDADLTRPLSGSGSVVSFATPPTARPSGRPTPVADEVTVGADDLIHAQRSRSRHVDAETAIDAPEPEVASAAADPVAARATDTIEDLEAADFDPDDVPTRRDPGADESTAATDDDPAATTPDTSTPARRPRKASRKPAVPAWEDVLLGVRSNGSQ